MMPVPFSLIIQKDHQRETRRGCDFLSLQSKRRMKFLFLNCLFTFV
jgi:hypothetical protein